MGWRTVCNFQSQLPGKFHFRFLRVVESSALCQACAPYICVTVVCTPMQLCNESKKHPYNIIVPSDTHTRARARRHCSARTRTTANSRGVLTSSSSSRPPAPGRQQNGQRQLIATQQPPPLCSSGRASDSRCRITTVPLSSPGRGAGTTHVRATGSVMPTATSEARRAAERT
jgi:hypothetical protein